MVVIETVSSIAFTFSLGVGALASGRLDLLGRLFSVRVYDVNKGDLPAVRVLLNHCLAGNVIEAAELLPGMESRYYALSDWVSGVIRQYTKDIIPNDTQYALFFAKLEILLALGFAHHGGRGFSYWVPQGTFVYLQDERDRILNEIRESLERLNDESPFVKSGIFGDTADTCRRGLDDFVEFLSTLRRF